ncbi:MAG: RNA 2',3'-cyclic phosphodiesterase [Candidatus Omnitrophica bacterium]|nr:RNA 2',3'-cyclic phosphodiesterase [Candidatus Omnitrophota bacterium]
MIRTFIAIEIPDSVKRALQSFQQKIQGLPAQITWVKPQNIHLTLRFLGDTQETVLPKLKTLLEDKCKGLSPLKLELGEFGVFESIQNPRVLWVGLTGNLGPLEKFARQIELGVRELRFPKESKPFNAHLTLGRVRRVPDRRHMAEALEQAIALWAGTRSAKPFSLERVHLIQSELSASGPAYTPLWTQDFSAES